MRTPETPLSQGQPPDREAREEQAGRRLGAGLAALACVGLLGAAAVYAYAVIQHLKLFPIIRGLAPHKRFRVLLAGVEDFAPLLARATGAAGGWLTLLAAAGAILLATEPTQGPDPRPEARLRPRFFSAMFLSLIGCAVVSATYLGFERERLWTEWAAMGTVALAGLLGATGGRARASTRRLPWGLLPVTLATAAFLFGVADVMLRWFTVGNYFQAYQEDPLPEPKILFVQANAPRGMLAFLAPALVLIVLAAWRWAANGGLSPGLRSRSPHVLAAVAGVLVLTCVGLDRKLRVDLGECTGGSGSNEDLMAFVRVPRPFVPRKPLLE